MREDFAAIPLRTLTPVRNFSSLAQVAERSYRPLQRNSKNNKIQGKSKIIKSIETALKHYLIILQNSVLQKFCSFRLPNKNY